MRTIKFVECQEDMDKFRKMLDARMKYGCSDENPTEEGVFIAPDVGKEFVDLPWLVLDNRGHQGYLEDFETLDGALSYATDGHTTNEKQHEWDVNGKFLDELSERCRWLKDEPDELREVGIGSERLKKAKEETMKKWEDDEKETFEAIKRKSGISDRFVTAMAEDDDPEELEAAFVDSVVHDAYGVHSVEFPVIGGEPCVRIVFRNEAGQTVHVDGILERFNMLNWRRVCDRFAEVVLRFGGKNSEKFDWPTPNVRVEYRADADADDVITSVSLVWQTDYGTWDALKDAMVVVKSVREAEKAIPEPQDCKQNVVELCPNCDMEARLVIDAEKFGYKTKCPNCGKTLLLCDACHQDGNDNHCDKCNKELKKESDEGKEKINLWCNGCEEDFEVFWNAEKDGYVVHCPRCGSPQHLCDECRKARDAKYTPCEYEKDGVCVRAK